jgi:hypothetical protein
VAACSPPQDTDALFEDLLPDFREQMQELAFPSADESDQAELERRTDRLSLAGKQDDGAKWGTMCLQTVDKTIASLPRPPS